MTDDVSACPNGHTWTQPHDGEPRHGTPCDCGKKLWGVPLVVVREHKWEFYANGSFCTRCGAGIGTGTPCR